jgi:hypothetical protein
MPTDYVQPDVAPANRLVSKIIAIATDHGCQAAATPIGTVAISIPTYDRATNTRGVIIEEVGSVHEAFRALGY